ncbi:MULTISPECIES: DUF4129 domain-containing protein [unclassified Leifsonia]|uniref:DUF4129 domain-containing protein n=1 Tax=unclassified Leifsonia TaxID=2663824 RepID=UPI0008A7FF3C|nr:MULTISPECIES: DUF4129 domain-containing protein [unclassified Leifsonia]SEH79823.1 protein of unknown function [Leifsonia sp. CL154]SFL42216.1 protein of unknown function [Leifsonia sp. CL147]
MAGRLIVMHLDIPVDPSSPDAQQWLRDELSRPEYQAAKPTWFDLASKAVQDWIGSLFRGPGGDGGPVLLLVVVLVIAGLIVAAFFIFGRPRINRRSALERRSLFGSDGTRSAAELRAAAEEAARAGDWISAVEEEFRAIAAGLDERTLVRVTPGTTAGEFSSRAADVAPEERDALRRAARDFDEVRYLDRPGTEAAYQQLVALDERLRRLRVTAPAVPR